jgi:uncharacterized BrkB/YihY/UPF0761 family membrane protein
MEQNSTKSVRDEVRDKTTGYIGAALGLVAGFAWNEAFRSLVDYLYPAKHSLIAKFIYAAIITIVIVLVMIVIERFSRRRLSN